MTAMICSSDHALGRTLSVTSAKRENTAGLAEGLLEFRERATQNHAASAPRTTIASSTHSAELAEK
jgi:hypothetical protein